MQFLKFPIGQLKLLAWLWRSNHFGFLLHRLRLRESRTRPLQTTESVRNCELHPTNVARRIRRAPPRVDYIGHKATLILIGLFASDDSISGFEHGLWLFLNRQGLVIRTLVSKTLVGWSQLTGIVCHDCGWCLREISLRIQAAETWSCGNWLIRTRAVSLEFKLVGHPLTGEAVHLVILIHLTVL